MNLLDEVDWMRAVSGFILITRDTLIMMGIYLTTVHFLPFSQSTSPLTSPVDSPSSPALSPFSRWLGQSLQCITDDYVVS